MFGFSRRVRTHGAGSRGRVLLRVEALEWRDMPDGVPLGPPPPTTDPGITAPNVAPVIVNFTAQELTPGLFLITGKVIDESASGLVVTFGGATSASGQTVTCAADGTFARTVQLRTDGTDSGFLTATTVDAQGLVSTPVQVYLDPTL